MTPEAPVGWEFTPETLGPGTRARRDPTLLFRAAETASRLGWLAIVCAMLLVAALAAACDRDPYRIGVSTTEDGSIVIHYANCGGNTTVSAFRLAADGHGAVGWAIEAVGEPSSDTWSAVVGGVPPEGFVETVPYHPDPSRRHYLAIVDSSFLREHTYSFDTPELRTDMVLAGSDDYFAVDEFEEEIC